MHVKLGWFALLLLAISTALAAQSIPQPTTASTAATRDTSYIDAEGTAHVTRVVPVPPDLSPQARDFLLRKIPDQGPQESLEHRRAQMELSAARAQEAWSKLCPNTIADSHLAGVPVRIITPSNLSSSSRDKILINLHGGGFNADSGSFAETIPIAGYTGIKVIAVLYRLAPEHPFPAAVDDAVAVYRELLKTYKPSHMVLYGTSAGAALTAEVAVKLKLLGLPMPAALGIFSTLDGFAREEDSQAIYTLQGFSGHLDPPDGGIHDPYYVGATDPKDPLLSPIYADLHGLPPTLFITSGRDALLSGTANLDRAYLRAGVDARLVLFDALPHAFWYNASLPESIEANHIMADFMLKQLAH
ncbi:MAG TPA: alpha/beta hydrolase fold domain-containing protein [Terracidiphilus sp.]|jgi:epsilon-lactone hydrolase